MSKKKETGSNASNRRYHKTFNGKLMMTYNNMDRRVRGYVNPEAYQGKELLDRQEFYEWSKADVNYILLHKEWLEAGYSRKKSPSIDRIDSKLGYTIDNIEWVTHSVNSSRGAISRWNTTRSK